MDNKSVRKSIMKTKRKQIGSMKGSFPEKKDGKKLTKADSANRSGKNKEKQKKH
jgi:hypothetical protein